MSDLIDGVLKSSLVLGDLPYRVILPDHGSNLSQRFPVIYLLHGLFGSFENWSELTGLRSYLSDHSMIVVMPEGADGWYTDGGVGRKYESYLISELIPEIDARFQTIAAGHGRAIVGNSMGGYGAFKFALKYPEKFAFAASMSGAFHASELIGPSTKGNWDELGPSIMQVFGQEDSSIRRANDLKILAAEAAGKGKKLPFFYFDCGTGDEFISANREMDRIFADSGVPHEYLEVSGGHDWLYWDSRIGNILEMASRILAGRGLK